MSAPETVYIIHDNPDWMGPFAHALAEEGVPFVEWLLPGTALDLASAPPQGLFWSRLSASSHTRTDPHVKDYGRAVLAWLEAAGRTVINGAAVYELEVSKVRQHRALAAHGIDVPRTVAALGVSALTEAAKGFAPPFLTKHNQGGKGLGVRRFDSHDDLSSAAEDFAPGGRDAPIDGITLVQEYVSAPSITRAEFIGGRFHYALRVDVSRGSFELCPAEACERPEARDAPTPQFALREDLSATDPLIARLEAFLAEHHVLIAGVEFIESADGRRVVYDVNTNTNYHPDVEASLAREGREPAASAVARFIGSLVPQAATA